MVDTSKSFLVTFVLVLLCPASLASHKAHRAHRRAHREQYVQTLQKHHREHHEQYVQNLPVNGTQAKSKLLEVGLWGRHEDKLVEESEKRDEQDSEADDEKDDEKDDEEDDKKDDDNDEEKDAEKEDDEKDENSDDAEDEEKEEKEETKEKVLSETEDPEKMKLEDELMFLNADIEDIQQTKASVDKKTYVDRINAEASAVSAETETAHLGAMLGNMRSEMWTFAGPFWVRSADKMLKEKAKEAAKIKEKLAALEAKEKEAKEDKKTKKEKPKPKEEEEEKEEEKDETPVSTEPKPVKKKKTEAPPPKEEPKPSMGPFYFFVSATIVYVVGLVAARLVDKRLAPKKVLPHAYAMASSSI